MSENQHAATCAGGCTMRGYHLTECSDDKCKGCLPRAAEHGTLCAWCWQRLNSDIAEIPGLLTHLQYMATPYPAGWKIAELKPPSDPAERVNIHPATLAADELARLLGSWIGYVLETHPAHLHGPDGEDPCEWIAPHLAWVSQQDWACEMRRELSKDISTFKARWPTADMIERERRISDVRCPRCDLLSLVYTPPTHYRQPFKVGCTHPDCARVFSEDEWERLIGLVSA